MLAGEWLSYLPLSAIAFGSTIAAQSTLREIWRDIRSLWIFYLMTMLIHLLLIAQQIIQSPELISSGLNTGLFFTAKIVLTAIFISPYFRTSHPLDYSNILIGKNMMLPKITRKLRRVGFVLQTTMRLLPLILMEIERIRTIHKCRGLVLKGGLSQRISKLPAFIIPIIDSALRRSVTVSTAMIARGFDLDAKRTVHKPLLFKKKDVSASIYVGLCIAAIYLF